MARTVFDCARVPGKTCTLQIIGDKKDVLPVAKQHLVSAHGMKNGKQLEENISRVVDDHVKRYSSWV
jgi:predicted small metal-binding protein